MLCAISFFKLCKWYKIAQSISYVKGSHTAYSKINFLCAENLVWNDNIVSAKKNNLHFWLFWYKMFKVLIQFYKAIHLQFFPTNWSLIKLYEWRLIFGSKIFCMSGFKLSLCTSQTARWIQVIAIEKL